MASGFPLGVVVRMEEGPGTVLAKVHRLGLPTCQISCYDPAYYTDEALGLLLAGMKEFGIEITALWAGWPGRVVWDFIEGPETVGLVPYGVRRERAEAIMRAADFAHRLGVGHVVTHLGFVPEDPKDEKYVTLVPVLREIARHCRKNGQAFCWETGQETPVTLLRTIEDTGEDNVGVNLDPANLLLYGKANPVDALDILGPHVKGVHIKDGEYPVNGRELGQEKRVGEGRVDFPRFLRSLRKHGYRGPLTIECEFEGDQQFEGVLWAKERLEAWLAAMDGTS